VFRDFLSADERIRLRSYTDRVLALKWRECLREEMLHAADRELMHHKTHEEPKDFD
jgi:hypothetical protein